MAREFVPISESGSGLWLPGDRPQPAARVVGGWPPEPAWLDVPVTAADFAPGAHWPPNRTRSRQRRLDAHERLERGDMSDWIEDEASRRLVPNFFATVMRTVANLVISELGESEAHLSSALHAAVVGAMRDGRCWVLGDSASDELAPGRASWTWRDADDDEMIWSVEPWVSAMSEDGRPDVATVTMMTIDGGLRWVQESPQRTGRWGDMGAEETVEGSWSMVQRPPVGPDGWGQSVLLDLVPLVGELATQLANASHVILANAAPTVVLPFGRGQIAEIVGGVGQPTTLDAMGHREAQRAAAALRRNDVVTVPSGTFSPTTIEWSGNLEAAWRLIDAITAQMRMLTAIPAAIEQEAGDVPSGASIRQMFIALFWAVRPIWLGVRTAAAQALGREVDLADPFGAPAGAAPASGVTPEQAVGETGSDGGSESLGEVPPEMT